MADLTGEGARLEVEEGVGTCRICLTGQLSDYLLLSPCLCSGSMAFVHEDCLALWVGVAQSLRCPICRRDYQRRLVDPREGRLQYLAWVVGKTKQVLCSLGRSLAETQRSFYSGLIFLLVMHLLVNQGVRQIRFQDALGAETSSWCHRSPSVPASGPNAEALFGAILSFLALHVLLNLFTVTGVSESMSDSFRFLSGVRTCCYLFHQRDGITETIFCSLYGYQVPVFTTAFPVHLDRFILLGRTYVQIVLYEVLFALIPVAIALYSVRNRVEMSWTVWKFADCPKPSPPVHPPGSVPEEVRNYGPPSAPQCSHEGQK